MNIEMTEHRDEQMSDEQCQMNILLGCFFPNQMCFPVFHFSSLTVLHYRAQTKELLLLSTCAETWHSRTWAVVVFRKPQQQGHKCKVSAFFLSQTDWL